MASKRDAVADAIRRAIVAGEYAVGGKLPPEQVLADRYSVSVATVRGALAQLAHEGLIRTEHGSGSYVRDRDEIYRFASQRLATDTRDADHGTDLAEAENAGEPAEVRLRIYIEFADRDTASSLELPVGDEVLVHDRVMLIGGQPTQLAVSRYPRSLTRGTPIEDEDAGPTAVLPTFEDAGHTLAPQLERVSLHRATTSEAMALQVPVGSPCLRIRRTTRSTTGRILEVNSMTLVDRYVLLYEVPVE